MRFSKKARLFVFKKHNWKCETLYSSGFEMRFSKKARKKEKTSFLRIENMKLLIFLKQSFFKLWQVQMFSIANIMRCKFDNSRTGRLWIFQIKISHIVNVYFQKHTFWEGEKLQNKSFLQRKRMRRMILLRAKFLRTGQRWSFEYKNWQILEKFLNSKHNILWSSPFQTLLFRKTRDAQDQSFSRCKKMPNFIFLIANFIQNLTLCNFFIWKTDTL